MLKEINKLINDLRHNSDIVEKLNVIASKIDKKDFLKIDIADMESYISPDKVDPISYSEEVGRIEVQNV